MPPPWRTTTTSAAPGHEQGSHDKAERAGPSYYVAAARNIGSRQSRYRPSSGARRETPADSDTRGLASIHRRRSAAAVEARGFIPTRGPIRMTLSPAAPPNLPTPPSLPPRPLAGDAALGDQRGQGWLPRTLLTSSEVNRAMTAARVAGSRASSWSWIFCTAAPASSCFSGGREGG